MKSLKKGLSVLLSLVLCGSMVIPAFAASFSDLQSAINGDLDAQTTEGHEDGTLISAEGETDRYGYAWNTEANNNQGGWGIEAWDNEESGAREVQVNEDITYDPDIDGEYGTTICVGGGKDVNLNLGTHIITGTGDNSVFTIQGGDPTLEDSEPTSTQAPGELNITGGEIKDGGIDVGVNSHLTLNDTKVTGNVGDEGSGIHADPGAAVELEGEAKVSVNGAADVYLEYGNNGYGEDKGASINTPEGGSWVDNSGNPVMPDENGTVTSDKALGLTWKPNSGSNNEGGGGTSNEVEITDPDVPLAEGPVTAAEFIHKMWVLDGEPAPLDDRGLPQGVDEDHEYAPAIAWAASADIVPVDSFDAEALLTVALAREYLTNFAAYADMAMPELTALTGKDSDLVMNSDDVLDEFFGEKDSE